ncbi:MAG: lactate racemase domain-containing protein [Bryobacteraceae bacterium]|nr:lactate racemase domain-containing protein [Bryobacteraceae bacterium]
MSLLVAIGNEQTVLSPDQLREGLYRALDQLGARERVLCLPPDGSRIHSQAGLLTRFAWEYYGPALKDVLPAIGTHFPMTTEELRAMFGEMPLELFRVHDWRNGFETLGEVPAEYVREQVGGLVDFAWPAQVARLVAQGGHDLILSFGQVVPHEVMGMASYNKNLFVGTGGAEGINKSHFVSAVYGLERLMGRADNPIRRILNYASEHFARHLPVVYVHTVVSADSKGQPVVRGLFIGDGPECFYRAAELSVQVNVTLLDREIRKAVVYLRPDEYRSTWIGNKAIYRTRMALADGAELVILAPGVRECGEDPGIDRLIRKYGYRGREATLEAVKHNEDLAGSLGTAAHLMHGSTDGRFTVTYCPGRLTKEEVEALGFRYAPLEEMQRRYDVERLQEGFQTVDGEEIYFVPNPGLGLWASRQRFEQSAPSTAQANVM